MFGVIALDASAGTNIVDSVSGTITYGGGIMLPIMLALLGIGAAIGVYKWGARKGGVRT